MKETIHHLRGRNANGGITTVATFDKESNTTVIKYATCSVKDTYNKKVGVKVAKASKVPIILTGDVTKVGHTLKVLLAAVGLYSPNIKSLLHSLFDRKITRALLDEYQCYTRNELLAEFVKTSDLNGNIVSHKDIELLFTLLYGRMNEGTF